MITYKKLWWDVPLIFHGIYGSTWLRGILFPTVSALFAMYLRRSDRDAVNTALTMSSGSAAKNNDPGFERQDVSHEYVFQIFVWIIGFMEIYRTNMSYARWWEARTSVQQMTCKWADVGVWSISWDASGYTPGEKGYDESLKYRQQIMHLVSLLHAVALASLRKDRNLDNFTKHICSEREPYHTSYCASNECDTSRVPNPWAGQYSPLQVLDIRDTHQDYYNSSPIPVIGGLPDTEKDIIRNVSVALNTKLYFKRQCELRGKYSEDEMQHLWANHLLEFCGCDRNNSDERTAFVMNEVHWLLVKRRLEGGMNVSGPEMSRLWQILSDGHLGYMQARKIQDTPFPFAHAQMCVAGLLSFAFFIPIVFNAYFAQEWLLYSLTWVTVWLYFSLNEICRELEDPYCHEPNDIQLAQLAHDFNNRLFAAEHGIRANAFFCNSQKAETLLCRAREMCHKANIDPIAGSVRI